MTQKKKSGTGIHLSVPEVRSLPSESGITVAPNHISTGSVPPVAHVSWASLPRVYSFHCLLFTKIVIELL